MNLWITIIRMSNVYLTLLLYCSSVYIGLLLWAVVVAQLVEQSLLIPEVRGSNPVIGKNLYIMNICLLSTVCWKDQNKEKKAVNGPFKKIAIIQVFSKMHTIQKSIQQCCFRWLFLPFKECCSFSYWHRANSVWCMPKMEKLDYWSLVNYLLL